MLTRYISTKRHVRIFKKGIGEPKGRFVCRGSENCLEVFGTLKLSCTALLHLHDSHYEVRALKFGIPFKLITSTSRAFRAYLPFERCSFGYPKTFIVCFRFA